MRADRVEHEEHEQAGVGEVGETQPPRGPHQQRHRDDDQQVFQQPVLPVDGTDREREPEDTVDREQGEGIAPLRVQITVHSAP